MIKKEKPVNDQVKAVAPVVGFLLVVAIIFLAAAQYQANVVPQQERQSEADHFQQVTEDMNNVRSSMIRAAGNGQRQSQEFATGLNYGVLGLTQPPVPGVFLHLDAEQPIAVYNATNNEAAESFWDGERVRRYDTGFIGYRVDYNRFSGAGELYVEHGFMYKDTVPGITPREYEEQRLANNDRPPIRIIEESDQPIFDGRTITLYAVQDGLPNSDLTSTGVSQTTVEMIPASPRSGGILNSVTVTDNGDDPIRIVLPTRLPVSEWRSVVSDELAANGGYIDEVNDVAGQDAVEFVMEQDEIYNLRLARVDIQTVNQRAPRVNPEAQYVAVESPVANVREESTVLLEAEVRDKYNNGVIGQRVEAEARTDDTRECIGDFQQPADTDPLCSDGQYGDDNQPGVDISNRNGVVTYRYQAPEVPSDQSISFIYRIANNP